MKTLLVILMVGMLASCEEGEADDFVACQYECLPPDVCEALNGYTYHSDECAEWDEVCCNVRTGDDIDTGEDTDTGEGDECGLYPSSCNCENPFCGEHYYDNGKICPSEESGTVFPCCCPIS